MSQSLRRVCRGCLSPHVETVVDLGRVPAGDHFPLASEPPSPAESSHPLAMMLCSRCGLAQLQDDDTAPEQPLGLEPEALREQARAAVELVAAAGWLQAEGPEPPGSVAEFASPHGGSWLPLLTARGVQAAAVGTPAAVVIDSFGIMHEPEQATAFADRAARTAPDGTLLLQFHSLATIVGQRQWTALRHGHFAYYSLTALSRLLADAGMRIAAAWEFELYGGTVLIAARHRAAAPPGHVSAAPSARVARILERERAAGITEPATVRVLQRDARLDADALRGWLTELAREGARVYAYGAASRAVSLFSRAGLSRSLLSAVADASPGKQGRRMPGTDIPVISPAELVSAAPDVVWLTLADLLPEVQGQYPELAGRWRTDWASLMEGTGQGR